MPTIRSLRREDGFVLPTVLFSAILLTLFLLVALTAVLRNAQLGRVDQDGKIATAAAEAGLEDYLSRLNGDPDYWRRGNDPGNPAIAAGGRAVEGTKGVAGRFQYRVLSQIDDTARTGVVRLQVTGSSSPGPGRTGATRSLTATLRPRTFLDFAYLSDVEVIDPALTGSDPACANYAYGPNSRQGLSCPSIIWRGGDKIDGPLHSNDALTIDSPPQFNSPKTESSWPDIEGADAKAKTWLGASPTVVGNRPVYAPTLPLPEGNTELTTYVAPDVDGDGTSGPGCYYSGATYIHFHGKTMDVWSPSTTRPDTPDRCLTVASSSVQQFNKDIPPVIYVDGTSATCTNGAIGYPITNEAVTAGAASDSSWGKSTNYDCHRGTVYVEGNVDSQVTVAGADDVVVVGDLTLADTSGNDVVGLIAGGDVWVHHPVDAAGANVRATPVRTIQAAILSLRHSFVVQNWDSGPSLGQLRVLGSIGQKMRGPVGATDPATGTTSGYTKNYTYDTRFKTIQPPYFLKPAANLWQILDVGDR